jgi:hypothetical protein
MMKHIFKLSIQFLPFLLFTSFLPQQANKEISKQELIRLYKTYYSGSAVDSINWSSKGQCDPGSIPNDIYAKVENRINFFRLVNRLPAIKIVADKKEEAQAAAFMMQENKSLNHSPPATWKCYSEKGRNGALYSCLGIFNFKTIKSESFITDYIRDAGELNSSIGHRRWLLSSEAKKFSYGATKKTDAIYCTPEITTDTVKTAFIAYPWSGYVPCNLIFPKWSFAIPAIHKVDFSKMTLSLKNSDGTPIPFTLLPRNDNYPDHTIVWKMPGLFSTEEENTFQNKLKEKGFVGKEITVKIENVKVDNKNANYEYKVKIIEL